MGIIIIQPVVGHFVHQPDLSMIPPWDVRLFRWIPWLQSERDSNPSIIESYGYRGLKKKDLAVKRGWTPWAASHFFPAKIWPANYFLGGLGCGSLYQRLGSAGLVSLIVESGFKHGRFTLVVVCIFVTPWKPSHSRLSKNLSRCEPPNRSVKRTIVEKALERSRERPKVRG